MAFKQRTYTEVPHDDILSPQLREFLASLLSQVNSLAGKGPAPTGQGIQALSFNNVDPTSSQINSAGNRVASIATAIIAVPSSTSVQFFWDGTNGSQVFKLGRDDGTVYTNPTGSGLVCSGLTPSTLYNFYPYFNESQQVIQFASVPGVSVGSPSIAFTTPNFKAAQQQILRGNLLLGIVLATTGVTTPASGTGPGVSGGTGGGGVGGGPNRGLIQ